METLLETPLISATTLDEVLRSAHRQAAAQKYRQRIRKTLRDPKIGISLGKGGTVQLTNIAVVACVATAGRWQLSDGEKLADVYKSEGLVDLITSQSYKRMLQLVRADLKKRLKSITHGQSRVAVSRLIPESLAALITAEPVVQEVIHSLREILARVDDKTKQLNRLPGQLVRFDGPEAIVTVNIGEREELRSYDSEYVKSFGLYESGSPFVLHELSWSPDSLMSVFFPALDLKDQWSPDLERRLKEHESSLPEPPAEFRQASKQASKKEKQPEPVVARA